MLIRKATGVIAVKYNDVRSHVVAFGSTDRRAGFNQKERKDLSLIICSISSFHLNAGAPHVSRSLTSPYNTADDFYTGGKSSDHLSMCFSLVPAILIRCFKMNDIALLNNS